MASVTDSVLFHWGIPGMKWGIRRFQYQDGRLTDEGKKRYRKGKHLSEFSDDELDTFIRRAQREETLVRSLRGIEDPTISMGKMFATEFIKQFGNTAGKNLGKLSTDRLDDWYEERISKPISNAVEKKAKPPKKRGPLEGNLPDGTAYRTIDAFEDPDKVERYQEEGRLIVVQGDLNKKQKKGG